MAVLENQNKALIEELKSLKELYTGKQVNKNFLATNTCITKNGLS